MDELRSQVAQAHRRLLFETIQSVLTTALFGALVLVVIALAVPKIWVLDVPSPVWVRSWLVGGIAMGLGVGLFWGWRKSASHLDAALEIDKRFGLKERVSSSLALAPEDLETEAGQALVEDASRRIHRIDVREKFTLRAKPKSLLPLIPALIAFLLIAFVPDAKREADAETSTVEVKKQIERSTDLLKKRLAERRKQADAQGLAEASNVFSQLEKRAADLSEEDARDRKQALAKLNDMAETVKQRRAELGDREGLKKQLSQLRNLKPGPADKVARAMKQGNFGKALAEIEKLQAQMKAGELDEKQVQQLAEQLKQMAEKMSQMAEAHQQAMSELQKEIERLKQAGEMAKAGQLQNQLDKMKMQSPQMDQLQQLANQLAKASQAASEGKSSEAASQMEAIAQSLQQMQSEMDQLEMLEDALAQLASAKQAMNCQNCSGTGCEMCQGGMGSLDSPMPGMGMGQGRGAGDRPEAETGSRFYDSRVKGEVRRGKAVVTGFAGGPNQTGETAEEIKQAIARGEGEDDDPLTGVRLPRAHRKHAQQYFDSLREGDE